MTRDPPTHNPDPDSDSDSTGASTWDDTMYDDWPIVGYDESDRANPQYIGTTHIPGDTGTMAVLVYDEDERSIFRADVDETEQRLVPRDEPERTVGPSESLGDVLEDVGDRLGLDSVSEFAAERLQSDENQGERTGVTSVAAGEHEEVVTPDAATFTRSNVSAQADHDLEFSGSVTHRSRDETGDTADTNETDEQVYIVEREFVVSYDDANDPSIATVDVTERLLRAEEPKAARRDGDTEPLEENATTFRIDLAAAETDRHAEELVEERCQEWHESRPEPIA